jgi:radical SAM superfamily enzyme YgiQ (UPF0313 family)|tara:strand:- start:93 stop:1595 length:1503 start_codon:yes stop_codon:yes gene_type:complete
MKILFCNHNITIKDKTKTIHRPTISLPLGILYMASYLRSKDWQGEIEIYDARLSGSINKLLNGNVIFGDVNDVVEEKIKDSNPDIVAISNMFSWQITNAFEMAKIAKRACPKSIVVIGGPHASSFPEKTLNEDCIDYVVMGEGEERIYELLTTLERGEEVSIQGVLGKIEDNKLLRKNKKAPIGFITNLDELPLPAYDMVDVDRYLELQRNGFSPRPFEQGERAFTMLTSRGCPHKCVFCSIQATMGYKWRYHSSENIQKHIDLITSEYACDQIYFEDDNFTHDPERYDEIIEMLVKRKEKIKWGTPNGIRGDTWTFERVKKTKESGCQYLTVAIESAVQDVLDKVVKKKLDLKLVKKLMEYCHDVDLCLNAFYVIGLPGEKKDDIKDTLTYAINCYKKYNVLPVVNLAKVLPGTELYENVINNQLYLNKLEFKPNEITTEEFDPKWVADQYSKFRRELYRIRIIKSLTSKREFIKSFQILIDKLNDKMALFLFNKNYSS